MPCTVGDGAFSIVYAKTLPGSTTDIISPPPILRITPNVGVIITRVIMAGNYITANAGYILATEQEWTLVCNHVTGTRGRLSGLGPLI